MSVVINFNFGSAKLPESKEIRQRSFSIEPDHYSLEPETVRYLIYEGLTPLDILQHRAVASGKGKGGKQCKKGQTCGNSCISATKTCKKGLNGAQKEKAKTVKAKTAKTAKGKSTGGSEGEDSGNTEQQSGSGLSSWQQERLDRLEEDRKKYLEENDPDTIARQSKELVDSIPGGKISKIQTESRKASIEVTRARDKQYKVEEQLKKLGDSTDPVSVQKRKMLIDQLAQEKSKEVDATNRKQKLKEANDAIGRLRASNPSLNIDKLSKDEIINLLIQAREKDRDIANERFDIGANMIKGTPALNKSGIKEFEDQIESDRVASVKSTAKTMLADKDTGLFIAMPSQYIDSVVSDGVKNIFEVESRKKTVSYLEARYKQESDILGIPSGSPPPGYARPIYGYMDSKGAIRGDSVSSVGGGHKVASDYGDVRIELRDDVKSRSTFTNSDSFNVTKPASMISDPSPSSFAYGESYKNPPKSITDSKHGYVEFQAYGGITPKDIAAVHFGSEPSKKLTQKLRDSGISIFVNGSEF